jgi:hypothetical protein
VKLASDGMPFLTLDDLTTLDTARGDPVMPASTDGRSGKTPSIGELIVKDELIERVVAGTQPQGAGAPILIGPGRGSQFMES